MGDRANVAVVDSGNRVYLYTHWAGTELPKTLQDALKRGRDRWDDPPYLARIIFSEMTKGDPDGETGYGISTRMCDNEPHRPVLDVDPASRTVKLRREGRGGATIRVYSFDEYVSLRDVAWSSMLPAWWEVDDVEQAE